MRGTGKGADQIVREVRATLPRQCPLPNAELRLDSDCFLSFGWFWHKKNAVSYGKKKAVLQSNCV